VAARGGAGALSLFEVLELVKDLCIFLADFVSQPHYDLPLENPDLQVSETHTDPKDQRTQGTITQRARFRNVPELKLGNSVLQRWFWNLFGKLHDLQQDEESFSTTLQHLYAGHPVNPASISPMEGTLDEASAPSEVEGVIEARARLVPFLNALLRRARRRERKSSQKGT